MTAWEWSLELTNDSLPLYCTCCNMDGEKARSVSASGQVGQWLGLLCEGR